MEYKDDPSDEERIKYHLKEKTETHCLICGFIFVQTISWKKERFGTFMARAPYPGCPRCDYNLKNIEKL